jgi:hypothetical protein
MLLHFIFILGLDATQCSNYWFLLRFENWEARVYEKESIISWSERVIVVKLLNIWSVKDFG